MRARDRLVFMKRKGNESRFILMSMATALRIKMHHAAYPIFVSSFVGDQAEIRRTAIYSLWSSERSLPSPLFCAHIVETSIVSIRQIQSDTSLVLISNKTFCLIPAGSSCLIRPDGEDLEWSKGGCWRFVGAIWMPLCNLLAVQLRVWCAIFQRSVWNRLRAVSNAVSMVCYGSWESWRMSVTWDWTSPSFFLELGTKVSRVRSHWDGSQ